MDKVIEIMSQNKSKEQAELQMQKRRQAAIQQSLSKQFRATTGFTGLSSIQRTPLIQQKRDDKDKPTYMEKLLVK